MKTKSVVRHIAAQAKSVENSARNARKRIARNAKARKQHMLHCLTGTREVPVLDLLKLGGPATVRVVTDSERHAARLLVTGTPQSRAAKFHNRIAAAFEAAGL